MVGVSQVTQRSEDSGSAKSALALMIEAAEGAAQDACGERAAEICSRIGRISVPQSLWPYPNPAADIAGALAVAGAETVLARIGILQQTLIDDACLGIQSGDIEAAVVAGGEARFRELCAAKQGLELAPESFLETAPDRVLEPEKELWSEIEAAAGLGMPVGYYALLESARCHKAGGDVAEHRQEIGAMYSDFSLVAADNAMAWDRTHYSERQIVEPAADNRMLAFPYTKRMNTQWNVDQSAALLLCSVALAKELGIPEHKWVFPLAAAENNHMQNLAEREDLAECPGAKIAAREALQAAKLAAEDIDHWDLYSCFPAAVSAFADPLQLKDRRLTVTGGMSFAGGPLNNYVLQATAAMAELLRQQPGSRGGCTSISGMLTKQAIGLWQSGAEDLPQPAHFSSQDVSALVAAAAPTRVVRPAEPGEAVIVAYTVLFERGAPSRAIAVLEYGDHSRTVASATEVELMASLQVEDCVGRGAEIDSAGRFSVSD